MVHHQSPPHARRFQGLCPCDLGIRTRRGCCSWWLVSTTPAQRQLYAFPVTTVKSDHKLDGLKQWKFILSQFSMPKVQNQGLDHAMLFLKALGVNLFHAFLLPSGLASNPWSSLACRHISPISTSVFSWLLLSYVCLCLFFTYKDASHFGFRLTLLQYDLILTSLFLTRPYFQF